MAMTDEQKKALRESLDKLTKEELADLNIALKESLEEEQTAARTERQKAIYDFLHPAKPPKADEPPKTDEPPKADEFLNRLKKKFETR